MKNILKYNKITLVIYMIVAISFGVFFNCYVIAATNIINVSGPASVEEGKTITFNVSFSDNVNNIWLSDGDIIKKGFSGTVKVNKIADRSYTVIISNISNIGTGKYIVINSGVGYIEGKPIESVSSNIFEITAKQEIPENNDNNAGNTNGNNENTVPTPDVNGEPIEKPGTGNTENIQKPSEDVSKPNNDISNKPNNNVNNKPVVDNSNINKPTINNNLDNVQNSNTVIEEVKIKREIPNTGKLI